MPVYKKVFRKHSIIGSAELKIIEYNPDEVSYIELIRDMRKQKFRQVIINSEIMIKIMERVLNHKGIVQEISLEEGTDTELIEEINNYIKKIKRNASFFSKLKESLSWAEEYDSIDIMALTVYYSGVQVEIKSNGIILEHTTDSDFELEILKPVLLEYLG